MPNQNIEFINLSKLELNKANPRLPSKFKKEKLSKENIINWMLGDAEYRKD